MAPTRHTAAGYWLEEAGATEPPPRPALEGEARADVVVIGGGYTGMWTAWQLRRLEPEARVAICEAGVCGAGPSGRNGGFVNQMWFSLPTMRERFGDAEALELARAAQDAVTGVGEFCEREGVDAWYRRGGYLQVSTAPAFDGAWEEAVAACRELGAGEVCEPLDAAAVQARCASPVFRAGVLYPGAATVQPARLALGLRRRLLEAGVQIYEQAPVERVRSGRRGSGVIVTTPGGRLRAGAAVLASGGHLASIRGMRTLLTMTSSHMLITEPVPDVLAELGWTGGECITDSRKMIHYFRTTPDGRIAFGWGGGRVAFGSHTDGRAELDSGVIAEVERHLLRFFPMLEGRRIEHAWGGPIDVSPSHLPVAGTLRRHVHYGFGYTGNGVGPSFMVGRTLASLALGRSDEPGRLAIVEPAPVHVPPEPFRFVGGAIIRRALLRCEQAAEQGRRADPLSRLVAAIPERIGIHVGR